MSIESTNLSAHSSNFAIKLFQELSAGKDENFFISPFSISTAIAMSLAGARNETVRRLKELLCLTSIQNDVSLFEMYKDLIEKTNNLNNQYLALVTANKLFSKQDIHIKKAFSDLLANKFKAEMEQLDFSNPKESAEAINKWVEDKTDEKIKNLISEKDITEHTCLILVNAIYFKANWAIVFAKGKTSQEDFHLSNGQIVKCDMMHLHDKKLIVKSFPYELGFSTCELPYYGGNVSMTIILSHDGVKLEDIEKKMNGDVLKNVLTVKGSYIYVNLHLPKFKLEHKIKLSDSFKELGSELPFNKDLADFSGINEDGSDNFSISEVIHQSVVEVNEEGTVAAAVTASQYVNMCYFIPQEFNCNRPFLFIIHDNISYNVLFLGKLAKPSID